MDEAKMGNYTNIRKQVLTETTVGVRGGLDEKGKQQIVFVYRQLRYYDQQCDSRATDEK